MHRFYVSKERIEKSVVTFEKDIEHQICKVLRLIDGNYVIVFDNTGHEYLIELRNVNSKKIHGQILEKTKIDTELGIGISLFQSVLKSGERFEYTLQKCTELGITRFVPLVTSRTIPRITSNSILAKRLRWGKIIREAAEQSGRVLLPELSEIKCFNELSGIDENLSIILWEEEEIQDIKKTTKILLIKVCSVHVNQKST